MNSGVEKNIVIAGFGGQGVLFLGTVIAQAAMYDGKNTTWIPSYGAEMRGGSANCYVTISDGEIASPIFDNADYAVFLSKAAFIRFDKILKKGGAIVANSSMTGDTPAREDIDYIFKPLSDLVANSSKKLLLNVIALGMLIKKTGILSKESVLRALEAKKKELFDINIESFELGYSLA